jgi:small subunit ribosomal protein S7
MTRASRHSSTARSRGRVSKMEGIKAFNRWSTDEIKVNDLGLVSYLTIEPRLVPKTGAKYAGQRFYKSKVFIVERFMNKLMVPGHKSKKHFKTSGHATGKASSVYKYMLETLEIVEKRTKENPVKVLVQAIENAAPREEVISIEYGGAKYPKAVECAPQRRIDLAMRNMVQGAYQKSFGTKKKSTMALAEEIVAAAQLSTNSNAISKKLELERQADSSR